MIYVSVMSSPFIKNGALSGPITGYRVIIYRYDPFTINLFLEIDSNSVTITKGKPLRCREAKKLIENTRPLQTVSGLDVYEHPIYGSNMYEKLIYAIVPIKWRNLIDAFGTYNVTDHGYGYVGYNLCLKDP
jgi:hypothetical protein